MIDWSGLFFGSDSNISDKVFSSSGLSVYSDIIISTMNASSKFKIDTVAPKLKPAFKVNDKNNVDLRKAKTLGITATDNLSGIKKYRAMIDDGWVLCEYEPKLNLLFYTFEEGFSVGLHTFSIEVTDDKNNVAKWSCNFSR